MKIELVKYTKQFTGEVWYKVTADGGYVSSSATQDINEARKKFEMVQMHLTEECETIDSVEI